VASPRGTAARKTEVRQADRSFVGLPGPDLTAVDPRTVELDGAKVDVPQAVVLVTG
jgi:fluoroquinolone resistance protein